ncbi:hypothetical protein M422DRAFT_256463 [Sphaerobolus stellatus SS14]|uniref:Uncharacterized protein n=1 Tax=Sphaerobolus stellatus (strain SS14) TaxID=990650 RepID=A0A0C9VGF0_SPHS4|nr:hypothetical protein M422DRAFT_256463 [Sphaerobolus stellatus SS14]
MQHLISPFTEHKSSPLMMFGTQCSYWAVIHHCLCWTGIYVQPEQDKASGEDGSALASPQKKAVEGYQMAVSLNIQDVILMEASEEHYVETVPVTEPFCTELNTFKLDPSTEWVIKSTPGFVAIKHKMGCSICDALASHCMAAKRSYKIFLAEEDVSQTVAEAWPELVRYQDDYYCLLEDYNALKETTQSATEECRAKINKLYEKLNTCRATIKNLDDQVQSLETQLQEIKGNSDKLPKKARYALYRKEANWATHNGYCISDIPVSDSKDDDEDLGGLPTIAEGIPQDVPSCPPTKLAHPVGKSNWNDSKVVHEAGIPAIGGSCLPLTQKGSLLILPPPSLEYYPGHWPTLRGVSDWVMESDVHDSEMHRLYIEGRALQPHEQSSDHTAVIFHIDKRAFTYWLGCEAGVTPDLAQDNLEPYFVRRVTKTIWNKVTLRSQLWANKIASLKGGIVNQFHVHDDLTPLIQESPYYFPPSVGEPMNQDESDPEPTLKQPPVGSSSLADRLDYGEGGSLTRPPADAHELQARISYFDSLVPGDHLISP